MVTRRTAELEQDLIRLRKDLERYRAATEAALQSLEVAIGHVEREGRKALARDLRRNRASIVGRLRED